MTDLEAREQLRRRIAADLRWRAERFSVGVGDDSESDDDRVVKA